MLQDRQLFYFVLFFSFSFLLFYKRIGGYWSTLTKAHALKEGKQNIFGGKTGLMLLHTYEKRRSYIDGGVNLPKEKHTKKKEEIRNERIFLQHI